MFVRMKFRHQVFTVVVVLLIALVVLVARFSGDKKSSNYGENIRIFLGDNQLFQFKQDSSDVGECQADVGVKDRVLTTLDRTDYNLFVNGEYNIPHVALENAAYGDNLKPLMVYIVPHSHVDPGWIDTVDGYYVKSVKKILDYMVKKLHISPNMTFIWAEILTLVVGYPRFIKCYSCSSLFTQVVEDVKTVITPKEMKGYLDEVVVGQDLAKIALSSAAHEHYKRVAHNMANQSTADISFTETDQARFRGSTNLSSRLGASVFNQDLPQSSYVKPPGTQTSDIKLQKSNILMLGPTGSGKTYLVSTLAKFLDVPFVEFDCTTLTSYGYVGEDVSTPISLLYQEAGCNIEKCQQGIILLDEIDKIAKRQVSMSTKDVGGESVQQALLKILEGTKVEISSKGTKTSRMENSSKVTVDTTNILFIGAGAFSYLDKHIRKRQNKKHVGFGAPVDSESIQTPVTNITDLFRKPSDEDENKTIDEAFRDVQDIDIIKYGFLPEFVGRMCKLVVTHSLSEEALRKILTEPKNALIKQYQCIFGFEKCDLQFTEAALLAIVKNALKKKTGARGLKGEIDKLLFMPLYDVPGSDITTVIIDEDCVTKNAAPVYKRESLETIDCTVDDGESTSQKESENDENSGQKNLVLKKSFSLSTELCDAGQDR